MNNVLGFEADEAPDLYQNSYAYSNLGGQGTLNGAYNDGVRASYGSDAFSIGLSGYDKLCRQSRFYRRHRLRLRSPNPTLTPVLKILLLPSSYGEDDNSIGNATVAEAVNVWAQYEQGQFKVAAEYSGYWVG